MRKLWIIGAALSLAACGSSPQGDADKTGTAASGWTTLGTRSLISAPAQLAAKSDARWSEYDPPAAYAGTVTQPPQTIAMPDGVQLAAHVTLPADASGAAAPGRFPVILSFNGYNTDDQTGGAYSYLVEHGYAMVMVDDRGTGRSTGTWSAFGADEQADFTPVMDWVVQQSWSDGRIAHFGESYVGITALMAAAQRHPATKAVFAEISLGDMYRDLVFAGGEFSSIFIPSWLALVTVGSVQHPDQFSDPQFDQTLLQRLAALPTSFQAQVLAGGLSGDPSMVYDGDFAALRSPVEVVNRIQVPTFLTGGLYDVFQRGEPMNYEQLKSQAPAKLLIGPWNHTHQGAGLPADGVPVLNHIALRWFDQYVKGLPAGADALPNVTQYVAGYGHYVASPDWPHPRAQARTLYLHGDRSVSDTAPAAGEDSNVTLQQPANGLCDSNTSQWSAGVSNNLPFPCQYNNNLAYRTELLYETAPLAEDLYLNGPIEADLWVSTTASDSGLSIRVDDMDGGTGTQISSGLQTLALRAVDASRSRTLDGVMIQPWHPFTQESVLPVNAGEAVLVPVEIFPTSAFIAKGHTLRFSLSSSDVTRALMPLPAQAGATLGLLTVYSDADHPSRVVLPAVPVSELE